LLLAMSNGLPPDCAIIRAPLIGLSDWEPNRNGHAAIPNFEGDGDTPQGQLTVGDRQRLKSRSPLYMTDLLPVIPYLVVYGEDDATVPRSWVNEFVRRMKARGADVQLCIIPGGDHNLSHLASGSTAVEISRAQVAAAAVDSFILQHAV